MPGATATMPPPIPLLPGTPTSYSQSPDVSYIPAVAMVASANTNGLETLMMVNSCLASPAGYKPPLVPATQMPNNSAGTRASAG